MRPLLEYDSYNISRLIVSTNKFSFDTNFIQTVNISNFFISKESHISNQICVKSVKVFQRCNKEFPFQFSYSCSILKHVLILKKKSFAWLLVAKNLICVYPFVEDSLCFQKLVWIQNKLLYVLFFLSLEMDAQTSLQSSHLL